MTQIPSTDFQNYLQSIGRKYKRWWNLYTLTDVLEKQPSDNEQRNSPFDFRQTEQTIPSKPSEAKQPQEKTERLPVLEGIRKYAPQHVLLSGKPGLGKSTALKRLLLEEAEQALFHLNSFLNQEQVIIPVLVELRYYRTSLLNLIRDWFKRHRLLLSCSEIETLLFQNRFLLLIDGLNEVPSTEVMRDLKVFRQANETTPMIFTTRELYSGGNLDIDKLLEMQPLTEDQSKNFVRSYLSDKGEQLWSQLGIGWQEFSQTPLLLWMLCELFRQTQNVPSNLGLVFRQFTQGYERHLKEDVPVEVDRRQWTDVLQYLAFEMMKGKETTDFRVAISQQETKAIFSQFFQGKVINPDYLAVCYLDDLLKYHLIQIGNYEKIEFRHQLLQEYYAAEYLLQKLDDLSNKELKSDYLNYGKWTNPLALMLALIEKEEQAQRLIQSALEVDLNLGARLAGEVKLDFREQTVGLIDQLEVSTLLKIQLLENTSSEKAVPILIQALNHKLPPIRRKAASALGQIGSETAVPSLMQALNDEDSYVRRSAISALEQIGSKTAIPSLIQALNDEDSAVRKSAASVLGQIGSETAVPSLIQALNHENSPVHRRVKSVLRKIGSETAVPSLSQTLKNYKGSLVRKSPASALGEIGLQPTIPSFRQALNHEDSPVRTSIIDSLRKIASETAIPSLIKALNHEEPDIRRNAASILGQIGSETAVPSLIQALNDEDSAVRKSAASALGQIGSETAVPSLIKALNHEDYNVRRSAISALGQIGSETAVPSLIQALKDEDSRVRWSAASALRRIGSENAVSGLSQALKDKDYNVRKLSADALGQIGSETTVSSLIHTLKDENSHVRKLSADALGQIGSETAVPSLIHALKDENSAVRRSAISALGQIGSETAVPSLIDTLRDEDSAVRRSAASALGEISSETAVPSLIQTLKDENYHVRKLSADVLGEISSETAIPSLIQALSDENSDVSRSSASALGQIGSPKLLTHHWQSQLASDETYISDAILKYISEVIFKIQARCQFYNYEIAQSPQE